MPTLTRTRILEIIKEELNKTLSEGVDHEGVKNVVTSAAKLLKSAEEFKSTLTGPMMNAVTPSLEQLIKSLEGMVSNPSAYVERQKPDVKTVSLRAVKKP
jgi:hypothetical protein